jgi:Initiator Replication protein, WH1
MSRQIVKKAVNEVKDIIVKQPQSSDQLLFSFMPTQMTRTTPFFPISKKAMKDRPHEILEWETSWGQIVLSGERLSVYDETILLNLLFLVKKQRSEVLETTQYQLCKLSNVKPATNTYNAIWESLKRLSLTNIELSIWEGKGTQRKPSIEMSGTIITWIKRDRKKGKLQVALNPYFNEMYAESFVTNINLEYRANLKGDVSKSIYRFLEGQSNKNYSIHILKLAAAINLNINLPMNELRKTIRKGLRELKDKGYLTRWILQSKNDIVSVWKSNLKLLNN